MLAPNNFRLAYSQYLSFHLTPKQIKNLGEGWDWTQVLCFLNNRSNHKTMTTRAYCDLLIESQTITLALFSKQRLLFFQRSTSKSKLSKTNTSWFSKSFRRNLTLFEFFIALVFFYSSILLRKIFLKDWTRVPRKISPAEKELGNVMYTVLMCNIRE